MNSTVTTQVTDVQFVFDTLEVSKISSLFDDYINRWYVFNEVLSDTRSMLNNYSYRSRFPVPIYIV
jgi:hypothetical protein